MRTAILAASVTAVLFTASAVPAAEVATSERDLVVVADLTTHAPEGYDWLYSFLEVNAAVMAESKLAGSYAGVHVLADDAATVAGFRATLAALAGRPETRAIDAFLHLHGGPGGLAFYDGWWASSDVAAQIAAEPAPKGKLRLLYSTACFGATHAADFLGAGFRVTNGARGTNTNAAHDYPAVMDMWRDGASFADAQASGNDPFWIWFYDGVAGWNGFSDTDSTKVVEGDGAITIATP